MNEQAIAFGAAQRLAGIVTHPARETAGTVRRAVLMSNVGMLPRIGPFRLYVELARAMADDGWWALRFDEAGLGDSKSSAQAAIAGADVVAAMDFLQDTHGVTQFVVVGLCSGVDSMHVAAVRDARVTGAVFIDGYAYPTTPYYMRRALRVFDGRRWLRYVRLRLDRWRAPRQPNPSVVVFDRPSPTRQQFVHDIASLTRRGVRTFFMYTATVDRVYNAPNQLFEILGDSGDPTRTIAVRSDSSDHLFTRSSARLALIARLRRWAATL